jgi:hypothetical protein
VTNDLVVPSSPSLSDFAHNFTIDERGEKEGEEGTTKSLVTEDILPNKFNGHHVPSVQSRLRTISSLTRKLSLSNSRILDNPAFATATASRLSRQHNGIGKQIKNLNNRMSVCLKSSTQCVIFMI